MFDRKDNKKPKGNNTTTFSSIIDNNITISYEHALATILYVPSFAGEEFAADGVLPSLLIEAVNEKDRKIRTIYNVESLNNRMLLKANNLGNEEIFDDEMDTYCKSYELNSNELKELFESIDSKNRKSIAKEKSEASKSFFNQSTTDNIKELVNEIRAYKTIASVLNTIPRIRPPFGLESFKQSANCVANAEDNEPLKVKINLNTKKI